MPDPLYPPSSQALSEARKGLAPETHDAFQAFSQKVFADGALPAKITIDRRRRRPRHSVSLLHPRSHQIRDAAWRDAAGTHEAIWVAAEMRAGAAYTHSVLAFDEMEKVAAASHAR
jgi:hypothetical protein